MGRSDWDYAYTNQSVQDAYDEQLLEYANQLDPGRALDLGCGTGGNSVELARRGWSVVAVDIAAKAIKIARAVTDPSLDIQYDVGDMTAWDSNQLFDLALISYSLPPAGDRRVAAIVTATKALVPGGTVITAEFDSSTMSFGKPSDFSPVEETTELLADLEIMSVESIPTKPHDHNGFVSHDSDTTPLAVIAVAQKPVS